MQQLFLTPFFAATMSVVMVTLTGLLVCLSICLSAPLLLLAIITAVIAMLTGHPLERGANIFPSHSLPLRQLKVVLAPTIADGEFKNFVYT